MVNLSLQYIVNFFSIFVIFGGSRINTFCPNFQGDVRYYEVVTKKNVPELSGVAFRLLHEQSRADIIVLQNNDRENFFCFGFLTPPFNQHGTPHILEHVVLCGSKNYPVRDPFLTMLKGSMQTFLNAMTYPDRTLYPASSPVEKDFFNLMSVYGDAVFFPLIREEAFLQEGYTLSLKKEKLVPGGVVFNEMKGVYSSHDNFASDAVIRSLFPTTCYRFDSGGDPRFIPDISLEELKKFHSDFYLPHNARIFMYGDIDLEKKLDFLHDQFLSKFTANPESVVHFPVSEPDFRSKVFHIEHFPAPPGSSLLSTVSVNWRFSPVQSQEDILNYAVLNRILFGSCGSPLYFALEASHLGQGLSPISGMSFDYHHIVFSAAIQKVNPENERKVEPLVRNILEKIVKEGLDPQNVEASLSHVEFGRREISGGPVGLHLARRLYRVWDSYWGKPLESLCFDNLFINLRKKMMTSGYFESFIQTQLIDNMNSSVVIVKPRLSLFAEMVRDEKRRLRTLYTQMSVEFKAELKNRSTRVKCYQREKDPKGILPVLSRLDIPREIVKIPHDIMVVQDVPVISLEGNARGIYYWKFFFDLSTFSSEDLIYFPILSRSLSRIGWEGVSYGQASLEVMRSASCLFFYLDNSMDIHGNLKTHLVVTLKALQHQCESALAVMIKMLLKADYDVQERLQEIVLELFNDIKSEVIHNGSSFVVHALSKNFSDSGVVDDLWFGVTQLFFLEKTVKSMEDSVFVQSLIATLKRIHFQIFTKENMTISFATDPKNFSHVRGETMFILENFSSKGRQKQNSHKGLCLGNQKNEGYLAASHINCVGFALPCSGKYGTSSAAHERLLANYLSLGPLWEAVRMKGGAYGVRASLFSLDGSFLMTSYRDPHVEETLKVFSQIFGLVKKIPRYEFNQALIGLVGREIRPLSIEEMLITVTKWYFLGIHDVGRQKNLNYLLECTPHDLISSCEQFYSRHSEGVCVALGEKTQIMKAYERKFFQKIEKLP